MRSRRLLAYAGLTQRAALRSIAGHFRGSDAEGSNVQRGIAQSGSAPALGAGCRGFESLYPDHSWLHLE